MVSNEGVMNTNRKPALLCSQIVKASIGRKPAAVALLEEISAERAKLLVPCQVRKGAKMKIDCSTCELRGKVVGCVQTGDEFIAEVAFSGLRPWSPQLFQPEHALNLSVLGRDNPECIGESPDEAVSAPILVHSSASNHARL
jgi:hypothetical protein